MITQVMHLHTIGVVSTAKVILSIWVFIVIVFEFCCNHFLNLHVVLMAAERISPCHCEFVLDLVWFRFSVSDVSSGLGQGRWMTHFVEEVSRTLGFYNLGLYWI